LVAEGYLEGIDFHEFFSPVVKHVSINVVLALVVLLYIELLQLDVKTILHGILDKEMYMEQLEMLVQDCNRRFVCKLREVIVWLESYNKSL